MKEIFNMFEILYDDELPDEGMEGIIYVCPIYGLVDEKKTVIGMGNYVFMGQTWELLHMDRYLKGSDDDFLASIEALKGVEQE